MAQQNGRLNTDLDNKLTSGYYDGAKWISYTTIADGDNEALGSTQDEMSANTVIGLLKALIARLPDALANNTALKTNIEGALPVGNNKIGIVQIDNMPAIRLAADQTVTLKEGGTVGIASLPDNAAVTIKGAARRSALAHSGALEAGGTYTSPSMDGLQYKEITGRKVSPQTGIFTIRQSDDGETWADSRTENLNVEGTNVFFFKEPIYCRYVQVTFTNGGEAIEALKVSAYLGV